MPYALITGASSGLGEHFAYALAKEKYDLILTARREDRLTAVSEKARGFGAGRTEIVSCDLSEPAAAGALYERVTNAGIEVEMLINNAGFGTKGRLDQLSLERELEQINLNVTALVALTRMFLPQMVKRGRGTIINVSSVGGFTPVPYMATYGATKAFVLNFSEALASELRGTGVTVTALCPGPTHTEFQRVAKVEDTMPSFVFMEAESVVKRALADARRGKAISVTGMMNKVMAASPRLMPRRWVTWIAGSMFKPAANETK